MRILYIGTVQFSYYLLNKLLTIPFVKVVGIITKSVSSYNADFCSLYPLALENGIPCFFSDKHTNDEMVAWIRGKQPDVIYCFGWSHLLHKDILNIPPLGVIGYHPSELPKNRGRHPIIWALALGLERTASTFFFIDSGVDSGDILSQQLVPISFEDDASSLYSKLLKIAGEQLLQFTDQLHNGKYHRIPQDHSKANYWRKRTAQDGLIDWRMSAMQIYNLVRALARPYPGAHCCFRGNKVKIWRVGIKYIENITNIIPGQIIKVENNEIWVKCGDGIVVLLEHEFICDMPQKGDYIL